MRKILAAVVVCGILLLGLSTMSATSGTERSVISAHELRKAFDDDKNAAEARYLGNTISVEGVVLSTGMSRYLTPNVVLSDREGGEVKAICVLPRLDANKLSDFKIGQTVTMSGRVYRLSDRGVVLKECQAVQ